MSFERTTSSSSTTTTWKYDVFLSFRGDDTRKGFTAHLYSALESQRIITFKDDPELQKGKSIAPELSAAIENSRFALIVLSKNYATSTWCLDELVRIIESMRSRDSVLPIFYDVDPSNVRKQTGSFMEAFTNHEERFKNDAEKVQRWRTALSEVASFSGWNSKDWCESKLIENIVEEIETKLDPTLFISSEKLVGIDSRLEPIYSSLGVEANDIRFIGIWGMGGIGKTTMARVIFEKISREFELSFILTDVKSTVEQSGLLNLQKQILSKLWKGRDEIFDLGQGAIIIRRLLSHRKVLLILDDVDHRNHLKYLAGELSWFGPGSRVFITTRNERLLIENGVERRLRVEELSNGDSLRLFSWKAFRNEDPELDFLGLSKSVVNFCNGLPLALEVLGSFLRDRSLSEWNSALSKLGKVCNCEIFGTLKISYDSLDDEEKKIFLDIACFFNREHENRVTEILTSCNVSALIGIKVLSERSLLTISDGGYLHMHDLLQEMGREIVRQESPEEPGSRSRLWLLEDLNHVSRNNTGTESIQGIVVESSKPGVKVNVNAKIFLKMSKLRYLMISNVNLSNGIECLPNSLRILEWIGYHSKSLPLDFNPENLLQLHMPYSCIEHLRLGTEPLYNLKSIDLRHSKNLRNTPNFSGMPNLEDLILEGCTRLQGVDPSIEVLKRLRVLNLKDCEKLVGLPSSVYGLRSLKILIISGCSKLKLNELPEQLGYLQYLEELDVSGTSITELPSSIGRLKNLQELSLCGCKGQSPTSWNMISRLFQFLIRRNELASSFRLRPLSGLRHLVQLNLSDCNLLEGNIPSDIGSLSSLKGLDLSRNPIFSLPNSICQLSGLTYLILQDCHNLHTVSELPPSILYINVADCMLLDSLPDPMKQCNTQISANCVNCFNLVKQGFESVVFPLLIRFINLVQGKESRLKRFPMEQVLYFQFDAPGNEIPEWFSHQSAGFSFSVEVNPGVLSSNLLGFVICAVYGCPQLFNDGTESTDCLCIVRLDGKLIGGADLGNKWNEVVSDHFWLFYVPRDTWSAWQPHGYDDTISHRLSFSFVLGQRDAAEIIKKCGFRLVYEEDVEELKKKYWPRNDITESESESESVSASSGGGISETPSLELYDHDGAENATARGPIDCRDLRRLRELRELRGNRCINMFKCGNVCHLSE